MSWKQLTKFFQKIAVFDSVLYAIFAIWKLVYWNVLVLTDRRFKMASQCIITAMWISFPLRFIIIFISVQITPDQYNEVVRSMEQYNAVPAKRLLHMVKKYTHHVHMKEIEGKSCLHMEDLNVNNSFAIYIMIKGSTSNRIRHQTG